MTYDRLLMEADSLNLVVKEKDLQAYDGRIRGSRIAIRRSIPTTRQKACVLAEELGHYYTTSGDIMDGSDVSGKQELRARKWAYDMQVGFDGLIRAKEAGCSALFDTAEFLGVTEEFLQECLICYREKYGECIEYRGYMITFDPCIDVRRVDDEK